MKKLLRILRAGRWQDPALAKDVAKMIRKLEVRRER